MPKSPKKRKPRTTLVPHPAFEDIVRHLFIRLRWPISKIARHLKVTPARVTDFLKTIGYKTRGRACFIKHGVYHRPAKLVPKELDALKNDLKNNPLLTHSALARKYGLSRERIRQISVDIGSPQRAKLMELRRKAERQAQQQRSAEIREARETKRFQQTQELRRYWTQGLEVSDIARRMGLMASTIGVRIVRLRQQHPDWFPFRNVPAYIKHADFYAELDAQAAAAEAKKAK